MESYIEKVKKQHPIRIDAIKNLESFLKNPGRFSVVVLGDRGTGKTRWIGEISEYLNKTENVNCHNQFIEASCASFSADLAEAELFGYAPGVFTGGLPQGKLGLFLEAAGYTLKGTKPVQSKDGGILFLDEIHHLDKRIMAKLLTALQSKSHGKNRGKFIIKRMGDSKEYPCEIRIVFGSNRSIPELREILPEDLFDRIFQLVVRFPSLTKTKEENWLQKEFHQVFTEMDFINPLYIGGVSPPEIEDFKNWLNSLPLLGNYRDLENIGILWTELAMRYNSEKRKNIDTQKKILVELKHLYLSRASNIEVTDVCFDKSQPYNFYLKQLQSKYASWAISNIDHTGKTDNDKLGITGRTMKVIKGWKKNICVK